MKHPTRPSYRPTARPGIRFPVWVSPATPCLTRTNSVLIRDRHGAVRYLRVQMVIP